MLHCKIDAFFAPRKGYDEREYEDAWNYYPNLQQPGTGQRSAFLRAAVADGATASSFASEWADMLVRTFVCRRFVTPRGLKQAVAKAAPSWWRDVFARPLPWYADEKARRGAFASLLGLNLVGEGGGLAQSGNWRALAVGDSCLFQVSGDALTAAFPLSDPEQFGDSPALLSSRLARNEQVEIVARSGRWRAGDVFILATDALAAWFLAEAGQGKRPWRSLMALPSQAAFRSWLDAARTAGRIRNDDATCVIIRLSPPTA